MLVIIPRRAAEVLASSAPHRSVLASIMQSEDFSKTIALSCMGGAIRAEPVCGNCVIGAWSENDAADVAVARQQLLAIFLGNGSSSIAGLPEEEMGGVLERLCNLANRLWEGLSFPSNWKAKKVEKYQSIFVSSRIDDIRIAYSTVNIAGLVHTCTGSVYAAYHHDNVSVPILTEAVVNTMPDHLNRPANLTPPQHNPSGGVTQEPDVVIERGRGEDRHLFSMSRSEWVGTESPLTSQQRRIINDPKLPLRIHGPGGSGKTLVLILKALQLLSDAVESGAQCKILIVLHNNEVRNNVRSAVEAIDERGFLATSKDDQHWLDIETLHGWCMRELRIDTGGVDYALHQDAVASKKHQDEILSSIVEKAIKDRLPKTRSLLSGDLIAHLEGQRDKLISNIRHEIAIRIKGRGMRDEQQLYIESPLKSFVGRSELPHDRYFLFKLAEEYEEELRKISRLDTDDVVLSMQSRLTDPLWNRRRGKAGYDYIFVDETHLFNENERRALPYLTRGGGGTVPIIMAFDEAQSIGGYRAVDLERVGIPNSGARTLSYVHRSSPDIYRLARDLVERSSLVFSEFSGGVAISRMSQKDLKKCIKPSVKFATGVGSICETALALAQDLRSKNYKRVGVIAFDQTLLDHLASQLGEGKSDGTILRERGDSSAGNPFPGIFVMSAEQCAGLEFDAAILVGADKGRVPPSLHKFKVEGHMSIREEACKELYTALTRARYHLAFVVDQKSGPSEFIVPWIDGGMLVTEA